GCRIRKILALPGWRGACPGTGCFERRRTVRQQAWTACTSAPETKKPRRSGALQGDLDAAVAARDHFFAAGAALAAGAGLPPLPLAGTAAAAAAAAAAASSAASSALTFGSLTETTTGFCVPWRTALMPAGNFRSDTCS